MLVQAAIQQIASNIGDKSHEAAAITSQRLQGAGYLNGILYGARSSYYWQKIVD